MISVSTNFLNSLRGSHEAVYRSRVVTTRTSGANPSGTEIPILAGQVRLDATADERSALDLTVSGTWPVNNQFSLLAPFGQEIYAERGIRAVNNGDVEYVPLGYFRIETVEQDDAPNSPIRITGRDRMAAIIEARMLQPRTFAAGTSFGEIILNLVGEIYPYIDYLIDFDLSNATLREAATVDENRYEFLRDIATSRGRIMYFDRTGTFCITTAPDATMPVWTVDAGPMGVLVNARRQLSRSGVYNAVVAQGTENDISAGDPPPRGVALDTDTSSATYFYGPYGQVPRYYASPLLYTDAQAQSAAESILAQVTGLPYAVDLSFVPNPALDPLDPVQIQIGEEGVVSSSIVEIIASSEFPPTEGKEMAFDQNIETKWLALEDIPYIMVRLNQPYRVTRYTLTSANDFSARDPVDWDLYGSDDGSTWTLLDSRSGESFASRFLTKQYEVASPGEFTWYILDITLNNGDTFTQLAEIGLYAPDGRTEIHVLDTLTIPLSSDQVMTANTRATVQFSIT